VAEEPQENDGDLILLIQSSVLQINTHGAGNGSSPAGMSDWVQAGLTPAQKEKIVLSYEK